ncbi:MAG: NnrS family protein, partial [Rhodocyclaceae bacterium]|nr:NnrS family protein [Rhodocyclaceae bacterium]
MRFSAHPLWLAGFRPFFALACLSGLSLPVLWTLMFAGWIEAPATAFTGFQWHAHEMFFGFGWAMLGGFLLTASKNWVKIRGYHGTS